MMQEIILKIAFVFLLIIAAFGRAKFAMKAKHMKVSLSIKTKREYCLLALSSVIIILPLVYVFTDWINSFNMGLSANLRLVGLVGFGMAVVLHNWTHAELKTNWSPILEIKQKQELVTTGPYKRIRHPMYLAFFIWVLSQGILLSNWVVLILGVVSFAIVYFVRVNDEERMMYKRFGKKYLDYMKRTGRLFPKF